MAEKKNAAAGGKSDPGSVQELIGQREQLRAWIRRLDEVRTEAPDRVAERVRGDYEDRLRRVTEELSQHREEIERELERLRGELREAEVRLAQSVDALDEQRLRHLIGELDAGAWDAARGELEGAVAHAEGELARTREEVERLEALATDITEPAAEPEAPPEEEPAAEEAAPVAEADAGEPAEAEAEADAEERLPGVDAGEAEAWDPFGQEFARSGEGEERTEDLPWLAPMEEKTSAPWQEGEGGEEEGLEFLNELEKSAAGDAEGGGELAPDDLAFLEELDRAISGSPARTPPPAAAPPAPAAGAQ
ncbi:MAG TPA: hypothetical protein VFX98_13680, partial [Longimicrobiaceae bacterium]|nr:hypothetical protein [Longimicrobiaceae bacterium]